VLLFCAKAINKESHNFELTHLEKKKNNNFAVWQLSGLIHSQCFFAPLDVFLVMKTLKDECFIVIKGYKLITVLKDFLY